MKGSKKDKKKYYCKNFNINNKRKEEMDDLLTGFLITTDKNKEKNCVKDAYNILNDAVEHLYPNLLTQKEKADNISETEILNISRPGEEADLLDQMKIEKKQKISENEHVATKSSNISDLLENELKTLRGGKTKLFYNFDTNCKGVVFIKVEKNFKNDLDVKKIASYIVNNVKNTKEQVSKNIARFIPVEIGMKAKIENFKKNAHLVLDKYFKEGEEWGANFQSELLAYKFKQIFSNTLNNNLESDLNNESNKDLSCPEKIKWRLEFKHRNNNSVHRDDYLEFLLSYLSKEKYQVDFKNPDFVILIEITNDFLCMSVLEDYEENKSYNLLTLSKSDEELRLQREKLINKQKEREAEKLKEKEENLKFEEVKEKNNEMEDMGVEKKEEDDGEEKSDIDLI